MRISLSYRTMRNRFIGFLYLNAQCTSTKAGRLKSTLFRSFTADAGDPLTTYLAKAISVSLRYRSLFLEAASPYAPINFKFLNDSGLHRLIRGMLKELRVLLVRGREARLSVPQNLATLFGRDDAAVSTVAEMTGTWEQIKSDVYTSAEKVLNSNSAQANVEFVSRLENFCEELDKMNRFYLKLAIARLNEVIM